MDPSTHFASSLVLLLVLSTVSDVSYGQGDNGRASAILNTTVDNNRAFTNVFSQLSQLATNMNQTGATSKTGVIMETSKVCTGAFYKLIKELASTSPPSLGTITLAELTSVVTSGALKSLAEELVALYKQSGGYDDKMADSVMETAVTAVGTFTSLINEVLSVCPLPTGTEKNGVADKTWAERVMQKTSVHVKTYTGLIKELTGLFEKSAGPNYNESASRIMQSTGENARNFTSVFAQLTDLMSGGNQQEQPYTIQAGFSAGITLP